MNKLWRAKSWPSGYLASSEGPAAAPHRKFEDQVNNGKQEQASEGGDVSPTHSEGTIVRPKQRPKKEKQRPSPLKVHRWLPVGLVTKDGYGAKKCKDVEYKTQQNKSSSSESTWKSSARVRKVYRLKQSQSRKHSRQFSDLASSNLDDDDAQAARDVSTPLREEESIKHAPPFQRDLLKKGSLIDANLLYRSGSHARSSLQLVEAHEEAFSDEEEASTLNKLEIQKGGYSGEKPSEDLSKVVASDEDEQHFNDIGVHAIEDHKQDQGGAQSLLNMDDEAISKLMSHYCDQLKFDPPDGHDNLFEELNEQQLTELYERLAVYRIKGYKLTVDRKLPELDNPYREELFSPAYLLDMGYFQSYEEKLEWYFDRELCWQAHYDDYQRMVLRDYGEYRDWNEYHLIRNTYEQDLAYVQYCETMAIKTKWIEGFLVDRSIQWKKIEDVAFLQALTIAANVHNVPTSLLCSGFREHLWSVKFDHFNYKEMDGVYFEIWKRVSKQNMDFTNALSEIHSQNMFPSRNLDIEHELKNNLLRFSIKDNYDAHVACINETVSEHQALLLIKEAVVKMCPKSKTYVDYARKKLAIAAKIGLVPKGGILEIRPGCSGDNGETNLTMDN